MQNNFCYDMIFPEVNVSPGVYYMRIILAWGISTLCYLPLYLDGLGYIVSNALLQTKYLLIAMFLFKGSPKRCDAAWGILFINWCCARYMICFAAYLIANASWFQRHCIIFGVWYDAIRLSERRGAI